MGSVVSCAGVQNNLTPGSPSVHGSPSAGSSGDALPVANAAISSPHTLSPTGDNGVVSLSASVPVYGVQNNLGSTGAVGLSPTGTNPHIGEAVLVHGPSQNRSDVSTLHTVRSVWPTVCASAFVISLCRKRQKANWAYLKSPTI